MVLRGQYLERMIPVRSGELHLEGLYHRGPLHPPCVVAAPHPQQGGSMDSPVVAELAWAITRAGHATLRFNYRGVGASQGTWSGGPGEHDDLEAAVDQLRETAAWETAAIAGYSFGAHAAVAVAARRPDVEAVVLVAPPTALFDFAALPALGCHVLAILGERDPLADRATVEALLAPLGARGRVTVVAEADHFFGRGLPQVGKAAAAFLGRAR